MLNVNMVCSSGTTQGKPKFIPFNDELMETTAQIYQTSFAYRNRYCAFSLKFSKLDLKFRVIFVVYSYPVLTRLVDTNVISLNK